MYIPFSVLLRKCLCAKQKQETVSNMNIISVPYVNLYITNLEVSLEGIEGIDFDWLNLMHVTRQ